MSNDLLKLRRGMAMRMADDSINEPIIWVRDVLKGDVLLWEGMEALVTGVTCIWDKADIVECRFDLVETKTELVTPGWEIDSPTLKANHLIRVIRFAGERK